MEKVRAVIFDWAGTMIDFGSCAPVRALTDVFSQRGMLLSERLVRKFMGYAKRDHVIAMLNEEEGRQAWHSAAGRPWTEADVDALLESLEPAMVESAMALADLIPGAGDTLDWLKARHVKVGSTTGYTRRMMDGIIPLAAAQGYRPESIVCAGETGFGRPAPLMIWRCLQELSAWPVSACVKVDDAVVGIEAGKNAGLWTIGVVASGNGVGLSLAEYQALTDENRRAVRQSALQAFTEAGTDFVLETVADLPRAIETIEVRMARGHLPGGATTAVLI